MNKDKLLLELRRLWNAATPLVRRDEYARGVTETAIGIIALIEGMDKPEPITQQALLDNGFTKSLGGGYCFEGGFYSIVVYFYNFHDAPMEIVLCGEGESVRFRYKQLEKMTLEDLLALKRIVEY